MSNTELIKELRALTQAGMKDCRDALEEAGWDLQKAVDVVKTKGLNVVSGREGKVTSEGVIRAARFSPDGKSVSMVEVNCQTDFCANSKDFKNFTDVVANQLMRDHADNRPFQHNAPVIETARQELIATTKENAVVRRWWIEEVTPDSARVFCYIHSNNKIGVLISLLAPTKEIALDPRFEELGNDLAMQIAAMSPIAVSSDRLGADVVARQKAIFEAQLTELNKPQAAWPKILEGKFNKWYTEVCLLEQESVVVPKTTIKQVIKNVGVSLGGEIQVINFIRAYVGEGIEKKQENFADEVAKLV